MPFRTTSTLEAPTTCSSRTEVAFLSRIRYIKICAYSSNSNILLARKSHGIYPASEDKDTLRSIHSSPREFVKPGETIEVLSYSPDQLGRVEFSIRTDIGELGSDISSNYLGNGVFKGSWTVPSELDLGNSSWKNSYLQISTATQKTTDGGRSTLSESFLLPIGEFFIYSYQKIDNKTFDMEVEILDSEFNPVPDVKLEVKIVQNITGFQIIDQITLPSTGLLGESSLNYNLNDELYYAEVQITAKKDKITSRKTIEIYEEHYQHPYHEFNVLPTTDYYKHLLEIDSTNKKLPFQAYYKSQAVNNEKILVSISWSRGYLETTTESTNENGEFMVDLSPPQNTGTNDTLEICFSYFDGSSWLEHLKIYPMRIFLSSDRQEKINASVNTVGGVDIVTLTLDTSVNTPYAHLHAIPIYKNTNPNYYIYDDLERFMLDFVEHESMRSDL